MKRFLLLALVFASMSCFAQQTRFQVSGRVVNKQGKGIERVVVNDGINFTATDKDGKWTLSSDTLFSKFISISTPADYELPQKKGLAAF